MSKSRPTIALCMIMKNEAHNLEGLLTSIEGCYDAIYITDTGSTDDTVKNLVEFGSKLAKCPIYISHFEWVNDFSAARQFSFDQVDETKYQYVMWLDGDDQLSSKEDFIHFRDNVLHTSDCWIANYKYAFDENGQCMCEFLRERIVKVGQGFKWNYFIHEGLISDKKDLWTQVVKSWHVDHKRTKEDLETDRTRNLSMFEIYKGKLDARMHFYWGKEAFDRGDMKLASEKLMIALKDETLQMHDRIMAYQYAAASAFRMEAYPQAIQLCHLGLQLVPTRAELLAQLGDCYLKQGAAHEAITYYEAARKSKPNNLGGATFCTIDAYQHYPTYQLAQIYAMIGWQEMLEREYDLLLSMGSPHCEEIGKSLAQVSQLNLSAASTTAKDCDDIVISTPAMNLGFEWDEDVLKTKGLGGSETACVEVARILHEKTGRPVKVFVQRAAYKKCASGVEYIPSNAMPDYFNNWKPSFHLAWRHTTRLTTAKSYVWSHDLTTPGAENLNNYDKIICLSGFHKEYLKTQQNVPAEKVFVWRNGIDPQLWSSYIGVDLEDVKNPYKVIFSSSPDRGFDRCIEIVKRAREISGLPFELHLFYGFDNMRKMGMASKADQMMKMVEDNKDFVHYHGNVAKNELVQHFMESSVWLYPANFIETHCITALEALASHTYPMVRAMGALPYTLDEAIAKDQCWITDINACDESSYMEWAKELVLAVKEERWKNINIDMRKHTWDSVVDNLVEECGLADDKDDFVIAAVRGLGSLELVRDMEM